MSICLLLHSNAGRSVCHAAELYYKKAIPRLNMP